MPIAFKSAAKFILLSALLATLLISCATNSIVEPKIVPYRHEVQVLVAMLNLQANDENRNEIETLQEEAMKRLEEIGGDDSADVFYRLLIDEHNDQNRRTEVLCALGRMGSDAALERIEAWRVNIRHRNGEFYLEPGVRRARFVAREQIQNVVIEKSPNGKSWALFDWNKYGAYNDLRWVTCSADGKSWKNPVALKQSLARMSKDDFLKAVKEGRTSQFETTDDADKDGLSDMEEKLMTVPFPDNRHLPITDERPHVDPRNADTDGDSIPDGEDPCPLTPTHKENNDITAIRQAVFEAYFATGNSTEIVFMLSRKDFAAQEYYGYKGVVLPTEDVIEGRMNITNIDVKMLNATNASVDIDNCVTNLGSGGYELTLKKIKGIWVVTGFKMGWIS